MEIKIRFLSLLLAYALAFYVVYNGFVANYPVRKRR